MRLVPIETFQKITGLSDRAMLQLLQKAGRDPERIYAEVDERQGLVLDIDSIRVREIVDALKETQSIALEARRSVIVEKLGSIIVDEIEDIFLEAAAKAAAEGSSGGDE